MFYQNLYKKKKYRPTNLKLKLGLLQLITIGNSSGINMVMIHQHLVNQDEYFDIFNQTIPKPFKGPLDYPSNEFTITLLRLAYDLPGMITMGNHD